MNGKSQSNGEFCPIWVTRSVLKNGVRNWRRLLFPAIIAVFPKTRHAFWSLGILKWLRDEAGIALIPNLPLYSYLHNFRARTIAQSGKLDRRIEKVSQERYKQSVFPFICEWCWFLTRVEGDRSDRYPYISENNRILRLTRWYQWGRWSYASLWFAAVNCLMLWILEASMHRRLLFSRHAIQNELVPSRKKLLSSRSERWGSSSPSISLR